MKALVALFAAALVTTAVADDQYSKDKEQAKSVEAKFKSLDKNADQQLSKSEAREDGSLSAQFASLDLNVDGFVSKSEFTAKMHDEHWKKEPR